MSAAPLAVLLCAGVGSRLRPLTDDRPKSLVSVAGEPILLRAVRKLVDHGVRELVLATGYREDALHRALADAPIPVRFCPNEAYDRTQNSVSLLLCREAVAGRAFYLLDGDVLFHPEILARLDEGDADLAVAVERRTDMGEEEMKILVDGDRVRAFGKGLDPRASFGESIGMARIGERASARLFDELARVHGEGRTNLYYEDVFNHLIETGHLVKAVDIGSCPWIEVDTPEDLARAEALVRSGKLDPAA